MIDGPLAPFGDAEQLRDLIDRDSDHSALYKVFLDVRDAAAKILENTTLADLIHRVRRTIRVQRPAKVRKPTEATNKKAKASVLPMLVQGAGHD